MSSTKKQTTQKLYEDVREDFNKLADVKEFGVQKYTTAFIFEKLALKYYRSPKTIENIVFCRV